MKDIRQQLISGLASVESTLLAAVGEDGPALLRDARLHAVFPGGGRLRPSLSLAVVIACGHEITNSCLHAAAAVELMHCASLVHDDLPCFDNAATRRGKPSVHAEYGEAMAVLVGDALIVQAFEAIGQADARVVGPLVAGLARAAGAVQGLVAGQACELDPKQQASVTHYHRCKTASLFEFAASAGALIAGSDSQAWGRVGQTVGLAYQLLDDIVDHVADEAQVGKPVHQDIRHERQSAIQTFGLAGALDRLEATFEDVMLHVPASADAQVIGAWVGLLRSRVQPYLLRARELLRNESPTRERSCNTPKSWGLGTADLCV